MSAKRNDGNEFEESERTMVAPAIQDEEEESGGTVVIQMPEERPEPGYQAVSEPDGGVDFRDDEPAPVDDAPADDEDGGKTAMIQIPDFDAIAPVGAVVAAPEAVPLPPGRLLVILGNDQGREYELTAPTVVVGRGLDCGVMLSDASVSRRHFQLEADGDVWVLQDLGSGNGTKVNGTKVKGIALAEGMRIEIGQTLLEFAGSLQATMPMEGSGYEEGEGKTQAIDLGDIDVDALRPPPEEEMQELDAGGLPRTEIEDGAQERQARSGGLPGWVFLVGGAVVLGLVAVILVFVLGDQGGPSGGEPAKTAKVEEPAGGAAAAQKEDEEAARQEAKDAAHDKYNQAMKAFQAKDLDKAEGLLKDAVKLDPRHEEAAASLGRIEDERKNATLMTELTTALKADNKEEAEAVLKKIPEKSLFRADAKAAVEAYVDKQVAKEVEAIRSLLKKKQKAEAKDTYDFALELYPDHKDLKALEAEMKKAGIRF